MEARASFTRDFLVVLLISLIAFFATFTDFPFTPDEPEELTDFAELISSLLQWSILLAIFSRTLQRDLVNREYFNQHPLNYRYQYIGKCVYVFLVMSIWDLISIGLGYSHDDYYSNSLSAVNVAESSWQFVTEVPRTFFYGRFCRRHRVVSSAALRFDDRGYFGFILCNRKLAGLTKPSPALH